MWRVCLIEEIMFCVCLNSQSNSKLNQAAVEMNKVDVLYSLGMQIMKNKFSLVTCFVFLPI